MTDDWERPHRPEQPPIEIPLSGDGPLAVSGDDPNAALPPNWRKIVGLTSLLGVVLGILLAVALITFVWDDEPEGGIAGDPTTTVDGFDLATQITTPPTLGDPDPVPTNTDPAQPRITVDTPTTAAVVIPLGPKTFGTLPDYPAYTGVPSGGLDGFDLTSAVASLDNDIARRATTHLEYGATINTTDITIVRDPFNDRYRISLTNASGERSFVVDVASDTTYATNAQGGVTTIPNSELVGIDSSELPAYLERLMLGPIRPDTLAAATVEPRSMVFLEGEAAFAREFEVEMPGAIIPEWEFYDLDPTSRPAAEDTPETLAYLAYVDEYGELNRVIGTAIIQGEQQLVVHRIELLTEADIVLLPDVSVID